MNKKSDTAEPEASTAQAGVVWDDSKMGTTFANVVNIQSTQEQVDLFFGTNQTWSIEGQEDKVKVELNERIIMAPHAAKRLMMALNGVMREYEARYGELKVGGSGG